MFKWVEQYRQANPQIKFFAFNWIIYGIAIIITTIYCYARLDFVRSNKTPSSSNDATFIQSK